MSTSSKFWRRLFTEGGIIFDGPPRGNPFADPDTVPLFTRFYNDHALAVAGPALSFVEAVSAQSARVVELSAWYLVSHAGTPEELELDLAMPGEPREPADHLSADLALQYLDSIYQRARVLYPADRMTTLLADILRHWPLSGVLADLPDGPAGDLDFGGHPGLLLLYAERLAANFKPAWIPRGLGAPYLELVWTELGKDPALLASAQSASTNTEAPLEERDS